MNEYRVFIFIFKKKKIKGQTLNHLNFYLDITYQTYLQILDEYGTD